MFQIGLIKSRFYYLNKNSTIPDLWISEPVEPRIYSFSYTKMLQTIQEQLWGHRGTYCFWKYEIVFGKFWNMCAPSFF